MVIKDNTTYSNNELNGVYSSKIGTDDVIFTGLKNKVAFTIDFAAEGPTDKTCSFEVCIGIPGSASHKFQGEGKLFPNVRSRLSKTKEVGKLLITLMDCSLSESDLLQSVITILRLKVTSAVSQQTKNIALNW